jgi:hypothetical protein
MDEIVSLYNLQIGWEQVLVSVKKVDVYLSCEDKR